jgi:LCP family protein required for cell wall assembly
MTANKPKATKKPTKTTRTKIIKNTDVAKNTAKTATPLAVTTNEKPKTKNSKKKKLLITALVIFLILALSTMYFGFRILNAGSNIVNGSVLNVFTKSEPLQVDQYGRANMLIFGTSEDDAGHSGALLADSIMVLSVNPETKEANTVSIPRDLWVKYSEPCTVGYEGKINAVYFCGINNGKTEDQASRDLANTVGAITGFDIQYYAKVNYAVVRDSVNALGGIDVTIASEDSRGIYDVNTGIRLPNGVSTLDGQKALDLSRSRNSGGGYGLSRSNFDREINQQLILKALQEKALKAGILANPLKVTRLFESLGNNIATNLPSSQVQSAIKISQSLPGGNIKTIDLAEKGNPILTTGRIGSQSVVVPSLGTFDYSAIREVILRTVTATKTNNNS